MLREVLKESIKSEIDYRSITEAFSLKNIKKVADLLASLASKKLSDGNFVEMISEWGEDTFKTSDGRAGAGFRYLAKNGSMIRFSFVKTGSKAKNLKDKFLVNRVDYWKADGSCKLDRPLTTIELKPWLNIVDVVDEIFDALMGKFTESKLDEAYIPKKLIAYAKEMGYTDDQLAKFGSSGSLKKDMQKQGLWDDEEYKGFTVEAGVNEVNSPTKSVNGAAKKLAKQKFADPKVIYKDIEKLTMLVATNVLPQNGMVVAGAPGIGKTYGMEQKLKELFGPFNEPDSKVRYNKGGNTTTFGLYKMLFQYRNDKIIVLDDADALLSDRAIVNMLKSAMDSYPEREISWDSNLVMPMGSMAKEEREEYYAKIDQALADPEQAGKVGGKIKMPGTFPFRSKIFFVSNMSGAEWQKNPHIAAIWSRVVKIDVNISREGLKERIESIIDNIVPEVPRDIKLQLLEDMYNAGAQLNVRVFASACAMKGANLKGEDISDEEAKRFAENYI